MAPRETKVTPKVQRVRTLPKTNTTITKKPPATAVTTTVKTRTAKKVTEQTPLKAINCKVDMPQKLNSVPATPKPKENKAAPCPASVTKSAKKSWMRRPKNAHSGVPVPEKMRKILQQRLLDDSDHS